MTKALLKDQAESEDFPPIIDIIEVTDTRISHFVQLKGEVSRLSDSGLMVVEGEQQIERLLKSQRSLKSLFLEPSLYPQFRPFLVSSDQQNCELFRAPRKLMEQIIGYRLHRGAFALVHRPPFVEASKLNSPVVVLCGVCDPENVGSICRTCMAFGINSLLIDSGTCDPYHRRSIRVSMGGALALNVARTENMRETLQQLSGRELVAVETTNDAIPLSGFVPSNNYALVFGSERYGIPNDILKLCQRQISIPMAKSFLSSLNVSCAVAVVLANIYGRSNDK